MDKHERRKSRKVTPEPLPKESPLWTAKNIIITPHSSGGTTLNLTLELIVEKFIEYLGFYINDMEFPRYVNHKLGY